MNEEELMYEREEREYMLEKELENKSENNIKYILIYSYHDTNYEIFDNLELLRLALASLQETFKNDKDFHYQIYCGKDVTNYINDLEKGDKK